MPRNKKTIMETELTMEGPWYTLRSVAGLFLRSQGFFTPFDLKISPFFFNVFYFSL